MENNNQNEIKTLWDLSWVIDPADNDVEYDVCDDGWDWCCCLGFQKIPEPGSDSYTRFCTWLARNLKMEDPNNGVYDETPCTVTCKVADLMWKHRDVFDPFFNKNNKPGFRPKDYADLDPDTDDGFYEAYLLPLESLIVGNYSDNDYTELLKALQGDEEIKAPPERTLAVRTYVYLKMRYGETKEEAWDRLLRQMNNADIELLTVDPANMEIREEN